MLDIKVSIIVPNFNHSNFLRERLESILNQTYDNYELILLDDCSSDESCKILTEYSIHPKVSHFIVNEVNNGSPFAQWKKGIELSKGEFIWIAESDDYADLDFLEELVCLLDNHPTAGLAYCQSYIVDESSQVLRTNQAWTDDLDPERWKKTFFNKGIDEVDNYLSKKCTIPNASAVLIRKSAIKIDALQVEFKKMGDWHLWITILNKYDIVFTPKTLNYFRDTSYSTRVLDSIPKLLNYYEEKILILIYLNSILFNKNNYVITERKKMIKEYITVSSIKKLLTSKFYRDILLKTDFLYTNTLIFEKIDFKNFFLRRFTNL